jgi:hypothetical protein
MKRIIVGLVSGFVTLGAIVSGAPAASADVVVPKVCFFDNPAELRYSLSTNFFGGVGFLSMGNESAGPTVDIPADKLLDGATFSGDCPSNLQPSTTSGPPYFYYRDSGSFGDTSYYQDGIKKYRTPLQFAINEQGGIRWTSKNMNGYYSYEIVSEVYYRPTGFNPAVNSRESDVYLRMNNYGFNAEFLNRWIEMQPSALYSKSIWTGNAATENCNFDESTCPGGYKFETYVIVPKNTMYVKWKSLSTKLSAKPGKKKGSAVTVTVNVDRLYTDAQGKDIKSYSGDKVTIMRGTKVVGTAKVNKNGIAKVKIKDIKGENLYTVTIPETNRNWDATTTFVK